MASAALLQFCNSYCEEDRLKEEKQKKCAPATSAKKASERVLLEMLTSDERAPKRMKLEYDDESYVIQVKEKKQQRSASAKSLVNFLRNTWDESISELASELQNAAGDDPSHAFCGWVVKTSLGDEKVTKTLEMRPAKKGARGEEDEIENASPQCTELARTIADAKHTLKQARETHREKSVDIVNNKRNSEQLLAQELQSLPEGQVKRVNLQNRDGTHDSFYLRVKTAPPKLKRITPRKLRAKS